MSSFIACPTALTFYDGVLAPNGGFARGRCQVTKHR
jgi:hypothetical protein